MPVFGSPNRLNSMHRHPWPRVAQFVAGLFFAGAIAIPMGQAAQSSATNQQPPSKLKTGGALQLALPFEPIQFNPFHPDGNSKVISRMMSLSLPSLMTSDSDGQLKINQNYVSSFRQIKGSPQVLRLVLNPKATWSDGKKISILDFTNQWKALSGKNPSYQIISPRGYQNIKSIKGGLKVNEIIITLNKPLADWQDLFSPLLPTSLTSNADIFNNSWRSRVTVSAGPFIFRDLDQEQGSISWEKNKSWWGAQPFLDNIVYRIIPEKNQYYALVNGDLDLIEVGMDENLVRLARSDSSLVTNKVAGVDKWEQISFNPRNPILSDVRVRKAITFALSRIAITEINTGIFVSEPKLANNRFFPANHYCYKNNASQLGIQSVGEAVKLLDDAGWAVATNSQDSDSAGKNKVVGMRYFSGKSQNIASSQPLSMTFSYPSGDVYRENVANLVQAMLRAKPLGIDIKLRELPKNDYFSKYVNPRNLDFDLAVFSWSSSVLPIEGALNLYDKDSPQNFAKELITPELDMLIKKTTTEVDSRKRCELANQIDSFLWKTGFNIPLYYFPEITLARKNLANFGSFGFQSPKWEKVAFIKNS